MLDLERLTRRQHLLLALCGVVTTFGICAADVAVGLGLVAPLLYVGLLLAYHAARIERVYLAIGVSSGLLTLAAPYLSHGSALTVEEVIDRIAFVMVVSALATVLSRALRYQRELRARSATDELTGVTQHGPFVEMVTKEVLRAERYHSPFSLAVFEIDNLREVAASHGRTARDRLLVALAKACADGLRPTDLLGRIDDSLVAGLPETREIDAAVVAERLRRATFENEEAEEGGGSVVFRVTVGIAAFAEDDEVDDVLARAREVLGQAQAAGGNRVSIARDEMSEVA